MREMNSDKGWVDIHTRVLPGVDDGAGDWEETITLLKMAYEQGTRHLVATPHFSRRQEVGRLKRLYRRLERETSSISSDYHVNLRQEVIYFESILEYLGGGKALTLAGGRYVLVEFAPGGSFDRISRAVHQLIQASYFSVITHVEHYPCLTRDELLKELIDYGAYLQANFKSLTGVWMDRRLQWYRRDLKKGYVHFLATNMHSITVRPPGVQKGILWLKRNADEERAIRILRKNPEFILAGRMLLQEKSVERVTVMRNKLYEDRDENEIEINVMRLLYTLKKKAWIIILATVAGCMAAGLYSVMILDPVYTSTSMMYVLSRETTLTSLANLQIGGQLTKDYSIMTTGRPVLEQVIEKQGLDLTYNQLKEKITVTGPTDTHIPSITVLDEDPVRARAVVDEVVRASSGYIGDIIEVIPPKIMEGGVVPDEPAPPNVTRSTALGGMALAVISRAIVTLQVIMNDTIRSEGDVSKYLGINVLATIPDNDGAEKEQPVKFRGGKESRKGQKPGRKEKGRENQGVGQTLSLKNTSREDYHCEEVVKTLRTNIQFCGDNLKTIMFTGSLPSEGKSDTAFAVAASFGSVDKKVLLIDGDIRKSVIVKRHEIQGSPCGLSRYLGGQKTAEKICYGTNVESLDIILAGPYSPSPSKLLEDPLFKELLDRARLKYDYIIMDTPPMANSIDGAIIASLYDEAVIVINSGTINYHLMQKVKSQLERSGCRIPGAVLDRVGTDYDNGYYKRYYREYYGRYYGKTYGGGGEKYQILDEAR